MASPDINEYYIGKGVVSFKKEGDLTFRDMGNAPTFEFTPDITKLEHFSSRSGVKAKDRTIVLEKKGTIKLVLDEWTVDNLAIALLGDVTTNTESQSVIEIFGSNAVSGMLKFEGTNEIGAKYEYLFNKVDFIPGSALSLISDEWGPLELTGDVAAVNGSFGTATRIEEPVSA